MLIIIYFRKTKIFKIKLSKILQNLKIKNNLINILISSILKEYLKSEKSN